MLLGRSLTGAVVLAVALWAATAHASPQALYNTNCPTEGDSTAPDASGNSFLCNASNLWQYPAYIMGSLGAGGTAAVCGSTTAGMIEWTGSAFQGCNGSTWGSLGSASSLALSALTAATTGNTLDSGNNAQVWEWGTLTSGTAMSLTTSTMQGGILLSLQDTAAAATSTGYVLSVTDATTGTGYGVYGAMTATANTGYAGYFASSSTGTGYALYATMTGAGNTGYAGYFNNSGAGFALAATGTSYFNGSVGIGTAAPNAPLQIYADSSTVPGLLIGAGGYSTSDYISVNTGRAFFGYDANGFSGAGALALSAGTTKGIEFWINGTNGTFLSGTDAMVITTTGQVGIGTTAPDLAGWGSAYHLLSILGNTQGGVIELAGNQADASGNFIGTLDFVAPVNTGGKEIAQIFSYTSGATATNRGGMLGFSTKANGGAIAERMRIDNAGNVGIGTTSPAGQLDVESSGTYAGYFNNTAASGTHYGLWASSASANGFGVYGWNTASYGIGIVGEADTGGGVGILGQSSSTGGGVGVWGRETGAANTGYGGYFANTATSGANYAVYGTDASGSGYGGYFTNTSTGWALYVNGLAAITSSLQVGATSASCASGNAGTVQYTGGILEACNGTSWIPIDGGMHFISTQTASSSASLQWTGLGTSYHFYRLLCTDMQLPLNTTSLYLQFGEGATPTWETSGYQGASMYWYGRSVAANPASTSISLGAGGSAGSSSGNNETFIEATISNLASSVYKHVHVMTSWQGGSFLGYEFAGDYTGDTNAVTAIEVLPTAGTITSGTCSLYGMN